MQYHWFSVGDQDACTRKMCPLGPYLLEHIEDGWRGDIMLMANVVYLWNPVTDTYDEVDTNLPNVEYKHGQSFKILEDWYAVNVLSEKLFIGTEDGSKDNRLQSK